MIDNIRHCFANQLVNRAKSFEIIEEILGHADIRTAGDYAHVHFETMRKSMELALEKLKFFWEGGMKKWIIAKKIRQLPLNIKYHPITVYIQLGEYMGA